MRAATCAAENLSNRGGAGKKVVYSIEKPAVFQSPLWYFSVAMFLSGGAVSKCHDGLFGIPLGAAQSQYFRLFRASIHIFSQ